MEHLAGLLIFIIENNHAGTKNQGRTNRDLFEQADLPAHGVSADTMSNTVQESSLFCLIFLQVKERA